MPEMEMRLLGLAWNTLEMRSTHSRDSARFAGKLYFTPMIRCKSKERDVYQNENRIPLLPLHLILPILK